MTFDEGMVDLPGAHPDGELEGKYGQNTNGNGIRHPPENVPLARTSRESSEPAN